MKRNIFPLIGCLSRRSISPGVPDATADVGADGHRGNVTVAGFPPFTGDLVSVLGRPEPDENKGFSCSRPRGRGPARHSDPFKSNARSREALVRSVRFSCLDLVHSDLISRNIRDTPTPLSGTESRHAVSVC